MSTVRPELVHVRRGVADRIVRLRRVLGRATGWPLAVRLAVFVAALAAEAFTYPPRLLFGGPALLLIVLAMLPAIWPRSATVTWFWLATALGWLAITTLYGVTAPLPRLIAVTAALYLVHSGAALAAMLPYDAVVSASVVIRWFLRAILTLAVSVGLAVVALYQSTRLGTHTYLAATLVGLALTIGLAWLLSSTGTRRR